MSVYFVHDRTDALGTYLEVSDAHPMPVTGTITPGGAVNISQDTPGTTNRVMTGGKKVTVLVAKTRPSDTNAYAAKDTIDVSTSAPTGWTFASMARATGGSGYITKAQIFTDQTTNTETFRLHLFNVQPTAINDNAACTSPLYAGLAGYVGTIDFPACRVEGSGATAAYANATPNTASSLLPLAFVTGADANLYGLLETPTGFTPASGQKFTIILTSEQD